MDTVYQPLAPYDMQQFDQQLQGLLQQANNLTGLQRLQFFSQAFLGCPYVGGACGEGDCGEFDQSPVYRTDVFDCVTYINMVLALWLAKDWDDFADKILCVNYYKSNPSYLTRFHFMSVDWNVQNALNNIVEDITYTIVDKNNQPVIEEATCMIEKPRWLSFRSLEDIKLLEHIDEHEAKNRLLELHQQAAFYHDIENITPYVPLQALFDADQQPNEALFQQIPAGCLLEIVRPDWPLREQIGSNINISHVGFVFDGDDGLQYRQASTVSNEVVDVPLIEYLKHCAKSPTVGGINLQMPVILA
ncbi:MAG: DUF1460 domain-containing protein [Coxiellaceae bacterium]|nr:DUF1460 domain-containing protein [Coxiellaceae bacterium]